MGGCCGAGQGGCCKPGLMMTARASITGNTHRPRETSAAVLNVSLRDPDSLVLSA